MDILCSYLSSRFGGILWVNAYQVRFYQCHPSNIQKSPKTSPYLINTSCFKCQKNNTKIILRSLVYAIFSCADIDECGLGLDDCDENAICTNTEGCYICTCREGYCGDGRNCTGELCVVNYSNSHEIMCFQVMKEWHQNNNPQNLHLSACTLTWCMVHHLICISWRNNYVGLVCYY